LAPFFSKRRAGGNPFRQPDAGGGIILSSQQKPVSCYLACLSSKIKENFSKNFCGRFRNFTATIVDYRRKYLRLQNTPLEKSLKKYAR